jgi:glycosyltransferase involved in cell wall biosynthesis
MSAADMSALAVSVVIPAYDAAAFIHRSIRSVLAQTQPPAEIVVVDDGSRDDTADVAQRLSADVVVLRQSNRGPGAARNAGVRAARSELVCFLDADDEYRPEMIAALSSALADHPSADVASAALILESGGARTRHPAAGAIPTEAGRAVLDDYFAVARRHWIACACSVMVRKRAFEAAGGFREDIRFGEDVDLWCRLAGRSDWVFVDAPVCVYHHDPATSATLRTADALWPTDVLMDEARMRALVRPRLWRSYREYRRDFLAARARTALQRSGPARARELLAHIPPAPLTATWAATWLLAHAPSPVGGSVLALNRRARDGLRRMRAGGAAPPPAAAGAREPGAADARPPFGGGDPCA